MAKYGSEGYLDFEKLWLMMDRVHLKKSYLLDNGIHTNTLSKLTKSENVTCEVIARLCHILKCQPGDIMEYKPPREFDNTE